MSNRRSTIPLIHEGGVLCFNQLNNFAYLLSETFFPNQTAKGQKKQWTLNDSQGGCRSYCLIHGNNNKKTNPNNQTMNIKKWDNALRSNHPKAMQHRHPSVINYPTFTQTPRTCRPLSSPRPPEVDSGRFTSKRCHHVVITSETSPFSQSVRLAIRPCAVHEPKSRDKAQPPTGLGVVGISSRRYYRGAGKPHCTPSRPVTAAICHRRTHARHRSPVAGRLLLRDETEVVGHDQRHHPVVHIGTIPSARQVRLPNYRKGSPHIKCRHNIKGAN